MYLRASLEETAAELKLATPALLSQVGQLRDRLLQARGTRAYPLLDDKVVTAWNGMMIAAYLFFAATGDSLKVYEGQVALRAELRLATEARVGKVGDLRVLVGYQACDETRCLPPAELVYEVRMEVRERSGEQ